MTVGIIGLGTIGTAIAAGLHGAQPGHTVLATTRTARRAPAFAQFCRTNADLVRCSQTLLLCVKPQQIPAILKEIAPHVRADQLVISTCAGVALDRFTSELSTPNIVRAMPNVPIEINAGVTALAFSESCEERQREEAIALFRHIGEVVQVEERHFDAVTAISGCGPAYVCVIIEALTDAGVQQGLPRETARLLVTQTLLGSAKFVLQSHLHPAQIRDRVTTPAGCTIDALTALEDGKVRHSLITAVAIATAKSSQLTGRGPGEVTAG
ncbi:MAG TPA: pyrroline-5-carboxylate reductase [Candidatus Baltobacteraceae bacterium]|jgi:pyrroline-5-carboxylate reductase|nr:pyrroline-5-carboxylate reductase [Candidatus Baltobacteraceae bacterium]